MPSRPALSAEIEDAAYSAALEGTTRYGLAEAAKAIFKNKLGHSFYPMPQELRRLHDEAMEPHERMRDRIHHQQRIRDEMEAARRARPPLSEAEKQRQRDRMARFNQQLAADRQERDEAAALAERRARNGMTDECLASIPNRPLDKTWERVR